MKVLPRPVLKMNDLSIQFAPFKTVPEVHFGERFLVSIEMDKCGSRLCFDVDPFSVHLLQVRNGFTHALSDP